MCKQWIVILTGSLSTDFNHDNLLAQLFALSCLQSYKERRESQDSVGFQNDLWFKPSTCNSDLEMIQSHMTVILGHP